MAEGIWQSADKQHTFRLVGDALSIDASIRIKGLHDGDLGIGEGRYDRSALAWVNSSQARPSPSPTPFMAGPATTTCMVTPTS